MPIFQLVAGHPALDLVNTLDWRFRSSGSEEQLNTYTDLLNFAKLSGLLPPAQFLHCASAQPLQKRRTLSSTKKLRECLASICYAIADGKTPPTESVKTLSALARTSRRSQHLEFRNGRLQWTSPENQASTSDKLFTTLLSAAIDLLTSGKIDHLGACSNAECRW